MKFTITIPVEAVDDFCARHGYSGYDAEGKPNLETKPQYIERTIKESIKADIVAFRQQKAAATAAKNAYDIANNNLTIT